MTMIVRLAALTFMVTGVTCGSSATAQDRERGQQVFAACAPCHAPDKNGIGPRLAGIVGRTSGSIEDFRYSRAMKNARIVWDVGTLDAYLTEPQKVVPGNLMPFSGIADAQKRAEIIAYLRLLKPTD